MLTALLMPQSHVRHSIYRHQQRGNTNNNQSSSHPLDHRHVLCSTIPAHLWGNHKIQPTPTSPIPDYPPPSRQPSPVCSRSRIRDKTKKGSVIEVLLSISVRRLATAPSESSISSNWWNGLSLSLLSDSSESRPG